MKRLKTIAITLALFLPCLALTTRAFGCDGRIVQVSTGHSVSVDELTRRLEAVDTLVLGERHGVAEHPVAAACLLSRIAQMRGVSLVLEHLRSDQQQSFDTYRHHHPEIAGGLG